MPISTIKFDPKDKSTFLAASKSSNLIILLHATNGNSTSLSEVRNQVVAELPNSDMWFPNIPSSRLSFENPILIVKALMQEIDAIWQYHMGQNSRQYDSIILVGHSMGALFARKIYVFCCGENENAPFENEIKISQPKEWAIKVNRILLLAAINRGWSARDLSFLDSLSMRLGIILGNLIMFLTGKRLLLFQIKKGAAFITQLRIQWLAMARAYKEERKIVGGAPVIQLLGTVDDIVSPDDNVDLVTGNDFVYLEVPRSGHSDIKQMDESTVGRERAKVFRSALVQPVDELRKKTVVPFDNVNLRADTSVKEVIFVIHGIRDKGFWTHKIANRVILLGKSQDKKYAVETSSYGYFPMLPFLLPSTRRANVEWLMDQYTEDLALYPNADFSYIGHSNGTYLLAQALEEYPACHFKNVVFAGSVVPTTYNWNALLENGRIKSILNYVASADWVVAIFPNFFQKVPFLRIMDIGGAGHDGFVDLQKFQVQYVQGGHGSAIDELMWDDIAEFAVNGNISKPANPALIGPSRSRSVVVLGYFSPFVWLAIFLISSTIGYLIWACIWPLGCYEFGDVYRTLAIIAYLRLLWFILTKV